MEIAESVDSTEKAGYAVYPGAMLWNRPTGSRAEQSETEKRHITRRETGKPLDRGRRPDTYTWAGTKILVEMHVSVANRKRRKKVRNENIVERFDEAWQENCRNIANTVKERRIILLSTRQLHPAPKSCCWLANGRGRPPTLNLEPARGVKAGF